MRKNPTGCLAVVVLVIAAFLGPRVPAWAQEKARGTIDWHARPLLKREGTNLLPNPSVNDAAGYEIPGDAAYDSTVSRSPGSGSLRIQAPWQLGGASATTDYIKITPNKKYTFGYYMYSTVWPVLSHGHIRLYDADKKPTGEAASRYGTTSAGKWEECVLTITAGANDQYIRCSVGRARFAVNSDHLWVDDWYLGEGVGFEQRFSPKKAFRGGLTRVDELGNFEVLQKGAWKPIFPFSMCVDDRRPDWSVLSSQGFNASTRATTVDQIRIKQDKLRCQ